MWSAYTHGQYRLVAGISAAPSMHVAISLWMLLVARELAPRVVPLAAVYFAFIWIASVQLGWHYASDGLVGSAGMMAIWWSTGRLINLPQRSRQRASVVAG
jgi:membrane-associated phospholipid phosphatase